MPFRFNPFTDKLDLTETGALPPGGGVQTLTGNDSIAVGPDLNNNINLIGGTGVTVSGNAGTNTETISITSGGFTWSDTSGAFAAASQNGYFITTTATGTLPASPTEGTTIKFIVDTTNLLTIQANTGQSIRIGTTLSAAAGTAVNTQRGDAITLVYRTTGTTWFAELNPVGGWNVT